MVTPAQPSPNIRRDTIVCGVLQCRGIVNPSVYVTTSCFEVSNLGDCTRRVCIGVGRDD